MPNRPVKVILHCSASQDSKKSKFSFEDCKKYHVEKKGWTDIGYHYYIERNGKVYEGRKVAVIGAHCLGHNKTSIGICYEGTYFPTIVQIVALCNLYKTLKSMLGIGAEDWHGHYEYADKECPGFDIDELKLLLNKV